ncbi:MAG: hypothetical protein ABIO36_09560 [Pyrinomonadaceae bacterium]
MPSRLRPQGLLLILGFTILLIASSLDVINKYFGVNGMAIYALLILLTLYFGSQFVFPAFASIVTEKWANVLALVTFVVVIAIVIYAYPIADSGVYGGGSDADDALILAANALIHGQYPFYPLTYLGNPIAPMPGSVILAVPFVFFALFALQNIFWLAVFFCVVRKHLNSSFYGLVLLWLILIFSPSVFQNLVTATDRVANALYILTAMWFMLKTIPRPASAVWKKILPTVLLGIGLSSRSNFFFLVPLLFGILGQNTDWKTATKYLLLAGFVFALVTLPFWIYDPAGFTPLSQQSEKVLRFEGVLPYARLVVPLSGMFLAIALSFRKMKLDCMVFFENCAIVQLFAVLLLSAISSIYLGRLDLYFGHVGYGVFFLFFGSFAALIGFKAKNDEIEISRQVSMAS